MDARHQQLVLGQEAEDDGSPSGSSSSKRPRTAARKAAHVAALRGRYELLSMRGKGGFAEVWEARHLRTGHRVAIKIISNNLGCNNKKVKVEREIGVMRLLRRHPHVARFYEAIRAADYTYVVMELAASGELYDHVAVRERLPEAEARRIFRQLAAGVAFCHRSMVVHRDLKMENVLLDAQGNVKIADFGFSKLFSYHKLQKRRCGSPEYAAPELLQGRPYVGPEVDVWSCGIILYGMLCGRLPFDGADISDLARNIKRGEFRVPSWVSDDARDLISSMLIVRPNKRATMAEVAAHRWLHQPAVDMMAPYYLQLPVGVVQQHHHQPDIDAATVELLVTRHGFDRNALLDCLLDSESESESEEAVAYQLVLSHQQYYQHHHQQPVVGGGDECPMRRVLSHHALFGDGDGDAVRSSQGRQGLVAPAAETISNLERPPHIHYSITTDDT
ncbi:unnamed protein product [Urochloa humidicola]